MMSEASSCIAKRLKSEGEKVIAFFRALVENQWEIEVYTEITIWRVRDVLAHFVSAEKSFLLLFEDVRSGGSGAPENFSIDRFNVSQVAQMEEVSSRQLLEYFIQTRTAMANWVSGLKESELRKTGRHPGMGLSTLEDMIKMVYLHNQIHLRDVHRRIKTR